MRATLPTNDPAVIPVWLRWLDRRRFSPVPDDAGRPLPPAREGRGKPALIAKRNVVINIFEETQKVG